MEKKGISNKKEVYLGENAREEVERGAIHVVSEGVVRSAVAELPHDSLLDLEL